MMKESRLINRLEMMRRLVDHKIQTFEIQNGDISAKLETLHLDQDLIYRDCHPLSSTGITSERYLMLRHSLSNRVTELVVAKKKMNDQIVDQRRRLGILEKMIDHRKMLVKQRIVIAETNENIENICQRIIY